MRRCCRGEVRACPREKTPPPPPTQERRRRRRKGGEEDGGEGRRRGTMESGGEGVDGEGAREREREVWERRETSGGEDKGHALAHNLIREVGLPARLRLI